MAREPIPERVRLYVLKRDNNRCRYCGRGPAEDVLEIDHIHPVSLGGTNQVSNLATACRTCNRAKHATPLLSLEPFQAAKTDADKLSCLLQLLMLKFPDATGTWAEYIVLCARNSGVTWDRLLAEVNDSEHWVEWVFKTGIYAGCVIERNATRRELQARADNQQIRDLRSNNEALAQCRGVPLPKYLVAGLPPVSADPPSWMPQPVAPTKEQN